MKIVRLTGEDYTKYMKNLDGHKHALKKALWDEWGAQGAIRITGPSGRFIGIIRQDPGDPAVQRGEHEEVEASDEQMEAQAQSIKRMKNSGHVKTAPSPRSCKCAAWPWPEKSEPRKVDERGKPGEHHPKCAYRGMWERAKGHKIVSVAAGPTLEATIHRAGKVTNHAATRGKLLGTPAKADKLKEKQLKIPHPDVCPKCKDFTKSKKMDADQHHPTCEHFKKYKAISAARAAIGKPLMKPEHVPSKKNPVMLINLDTQETVRAAEPEEIEEGRARLRDEGTAFVLLDGEEYLLAFEDGSTIEPAEAEEGSRQQAACDTEPPGPDFVAHSEEDEPDPASLKPQASSPSAEA